MNLKRLLLIGISIGFIHNAYANDGYFESKLQSGVVFPVNNTLIQMISEDIIYYGGQFTTTFIFLNTTNKEQEINIGFPVIGDLKEEGTDVEENASVKTDAEKMKEIENYYGFITFVNEIKVERKLTKLDEEYKNKDYNFVYMVKVKFLPYESVLVTNIYNQSMSQGNSSDGTGNEILEYILTTGALWKNNIGRAHLRFYFNNDTTTYRYNYGHIFTTRLSVTGPDGVDSYEVANRKCYEWSISDFKPDKNIKFEWIRNYIHDWEGYLDLIKNVKKKDKGKELKDISSEMQNSNTFQSFVVALGELLVDPDLKKNEYNRTLLTSANIKFTVNSLFALKGYKFKQLELYEYYKNFKWYNPVNDNPEIKDNTLFSQKERELLDKLNKLDIN